MLISGGGGGGGRAVGLWRSALLMTCQTTPQPITGPLLARAPGLQPRLAQWLMQSCPCYFGPSSVCPNRPTDDTISRILHSSLTHIDSNNENYVRLLFIDYSSAFNTIVQIKLALKLTDLSLNSSLCDWIQDFLTGRPQVVKVGHFTSNSITLNLGAPQGCVLSPLLYSLYIHDWVSSHSSTSIIKFADDTVVLLILLTLLQSALFKSWKRLRLHM